MFVCARVAERVCLSVLVCAPTQLPARSGPDWGEVGGLAAIAFARKRFGGAFMDPARGLCIGIDGVDLSDCNVTADEVSVNMRSLMGSDELDLPWDEKFAVVLVIEGLQGMISGQEWQLSVSGQTVGKHSTAELRAGVRIMI